eukprot:gnl/MRDRNA2_/MRDRNA2_94043_c0_seq1.p2 gnl/MRDRNA2_/MRDRNA2_94043_c0~~gnl/MRDRNA2_/MRDRNA2_94043_c0_seq1.p2  ORF type:complete len:120 (-),score=23.74 gnl/MRDRNA2_/MRDRNA2_94043_c0_seq1:49-408(-)
MKFSKPLLFVGAFGAVLDAALLRAPAVSLSAQPNGGGQQEDTKALACQECQEHAPYLNSSNPCVCHVKEIAAFHATNLTASSAANSTTVVLSAKTNSTSSKASGWLWHCSPVTGTWEAC